ncbi:hypothetical protein AB0M43_35800 [Longispora sp. NPDC051575]|uniref:hypothetical protein n=1 Tax=Longispora sp. NPDC051575 TaxID=3154943 RepID=UPI003426163C
MNLHPALLRAAVVLAAPLALAGTVATPAGAHAVSGPAFTVQCGNDSRLNIRCYLDHSSPDAPTIRWSHNGTPWPRFNDATSAAIGCSLGHRGTIRVDFTNSQGTSSATNYYLCTGVSDL